MAGIAQLAPVAGVAAPVPLAVLAPLGAVGPVPGIGVEGIAVDGWRCWTTSILQLPKACPLMLLL